MCQVSCVTCQMTHVTCHMSHVTFFFTKGSVINKVYPVQFLDFSFFKRVDTQYLLNLACSGPFWVTKKSKLMKIEFLRHCNRLEVPEMTNFCGRRISPKCIFSKVRNFLVQLVQCFFMVKINNKVLKNSKKSKNQKKNPIVLYFLFQKNL